MNKSAKSSLVWPTFRRFYVCFLDSLIASFIFAICARQYSVFLKRPEASSSSSAVNYSSFMNYSRPFFLASASLAHGAA